MYMRITVHSTGDRTQDLRIAERVRRDILAHALVKFAPGNPVRGIHRDEDARAYFEFSAPNDHDVSRVINDFGHANAVDLAQAQEIFGDACESCGNIAGPVLPAVCPNCGFHDVSPCPNCGAEVPRQDYVRLGSNVFKCPNCEHRVRLRFNEPMFLSDGTYNQPLVIVEGAEVPAT